MFALNAGSTGGPATSAECADYAETIGAVDFPVMADNDRLIAGATPLNQQTHPEMCALGPDMTILSCYTGHGSYLTALDDIREHAAR